MDASLNRKSLAIGIPGIVLQMVGQFLPIAMGYTPPHDVPQGLAAGGLAMLLIGTVMLIVGLCFYAKAKGRSPMWGLLGLFSIIGLIILALLKDNHKAGIAQLS